MNFQSFQESKTGTLKKLEKASALSASEKPEDQDRAREYRVAADFKSWRNQKRSGKLKEGGIPKQSKPNEPYDGGKPVEEEVGISSTEKMQKAMKDAQLKKKEDEAVAKAKKVKEDVELDELNRYGKETGKATGSLNKSPGSPVKKGGDAPGALRSVRKMMRKETGKPEGQQKKKRGAKVDPKAYGQPETSVQRIKKYLEKKRAAQADPSQGRYPPGSRKD